jgi:hypothetical protein
VVNSLKDVSKQVVDLAMRTAEKLRQEWLQQGMQKGIELSIAVRPLKNCTDF